MTQEWRTQRNCSLSPAQCARVYGPLCLLTLLIGAGFALRGLWFVLAFSFIDALVVVCALLYYARHATDHERIALDEHGLLIERSNGGAVQRVWLDPYRTRLTVPPGPRTRIELEARGVKVEVGVFAPEPARRQLALELQRALPCFY